MLALIRSITKQEWRFVWLLTLVIVLVTAAPYCYGYFTRPPGTVYSGLHYLTPGDTNVFLSMIEQVKQGHTIFLNLYTSEPQHRIYTNPLWLSVGLIAKFFRTSDLLALHLARSLWIIIFTSVIYLLIAYLFTERRKRRWLLLIVVFASGVGVFFNPFLFNPSNIIEHPTDTWVAESVTFLSLYHSPHLIASLTLIVLIFLLMLLAFEHDQVSYSIGAGLAGLVLLWFHPFNGPTIFLVLGTYLFIRFAAERKIIWSQVGHLAILGVMAAPAAMYLLEMSRIDWVIRNWSAQNILPSPNVWMYLIGYGFLVPLVLFGLWITIKQAIHQRFVLVSWFIASAALIYAPVAFQRRMSEGMHIPLALLAGVAIFAIFDRLPRQRMYSRYAFGMLLIIFLPLTNVQIIGQDFFVYNGKKTLPYYLDNQEVAAMHWLQLNAAPESITFSSYYTGNFIPAYSGRIVWIGHGPQTIDLLEKFDRSEWFWRSDDEVTAKGVFLETNHITYVYYGRKEKEIGSFNPANKSFLSPVFSNDLVTIYRVQ